MSIGQTDTGIENVRGLKRDHADEDDYGHDDDHGDDEDDDDDGAGIVNTEATNYINAFLAAQVRVSIYICLSMKT
jgi:hypothetical protein